MRIDSSARMELARQGYDAEEFAAGASACSSSATSVAIDVTARSTLASPMRSRSADVVGLDIAGIDLVVEDIRNRWPSSAARSSRSMRDPAC